MSERSLGIPAIKVPDRKTLRSMAELASHRMSHGGARILDELEEVLTTVKEVIATGRKRALEEDQSIGCKVCGRKPDSGHRLALDGSLVVIKNMELCGRLLGEIRDRETLHVVALTASPEWHRLRAVIAKVLLRHPAAAREVAAALRAEGMASDDGAGYIDAEEVPPRAAAGG